MTSAFLRRLLSFALLFCLGTVALAQQPAAAPPAGPPPPPPVLDGKKAGQVYKNLKVLKDVDAVRLIPTMRFFAGSLGVGCDHCHKPPDWQLDVKKEKETARQMIQMVRAINKNPVFKGQQEVTCNTCHRGGTKPEGIPVVTQAVWAKPPAAEPPAGLPSADELFAKYVQAVGGQGAVESLKTRVIKSSMGFKQSTAPLANFNLEIDVASPEKIYVQQQGQRGSVTSAIDGKKGWTKGQAGVRDLAPSQIEEVEEQAGLYSPIQLGEYSEKKVTGKETVNGHETYVVEAKGKLPEKLFFDTQSGLLVRRLTFIETAFGLSPRQLEFDDYRDAGGVKVPFSIADKEMTDLRQIKVNDIQNNVDIDAGRFARPAAAQGQGQ